MTHIDQSSTQVTIGIPFSETPVSQLESAIRSVFAQTHKNWQLILVADDAPAQCLELVRLIDDSRVHIAEHRERAGLARRLNDITAMTQTPFLFRMDSDDVMHPERIARQLHVLESGVTDLVASRAYLIDGSNDVHGLIKEPPTAPLDLGDFLGRGVFTHPTVAATSKWFRANPYDDSLLRAEDKALYISAARTSRMFKMREPLLYYRVIRPISASRQARDSRYDRIATRKYGELVATRSTLLRYLAVSKAKENIFRAMSNKWGRDYLFERKIDLLESTHLELAVTTLESARSWLVPGWPGARTAPANWL